ncbi:hypothetical protein LTR94_028242 [Friedmanniomyces endolithicus]|nr:hypothetical protein LTR94_028242 [Friedmanniomyces endolithicus]
MRRQLRQTQIGVGVEIQDDEIVLNGDGMNMGGGGDHRGDGDGVGRRREPAALPSAHRLDAGEVDFQDTLFIAPAGQGARLAEADEADQAFQSLLLDAA